MSQSLSEVTLEVFLMERILFTLSTFMDAFLRNSAFLKEFDENGYNLSLKLNGTFVYSNKEDVDALNKGKQAL